MRSQLDDAKAAYDQDRESGKLRDKVIFYDPIISGTKRASDSLREQMISTLITNSSLSSSDKQKMISELPVLSQYNTLSEDDENYFLNVYKFKNLDTLSIKTLENGEDILVYTPGDLSKATEYEKIKTLAVREIIDSQVNFYLQIPNEEQLKKLGSSTIIDAVRGTNGSNSIIYYNTDPVAQTKATYISGLKDIKKNADGSYSYSYTIQNFGVADSDAHELVIHPYDDAKNIKKLLVVQIITLIIILIWEKRKR